MAKPTIVIDATANPSQEAALEQRVQRLEDALAGLVAARVGDDAPRESRPLAEAITSIPSRPSAEAPLAAVTRLAPAPLNNPLATTPANVGALDLLSEVRVIPRMFFDKPYRVGWGAKIVVCVLLPLLLTSHWWLPFAGLPIVGPIFDKVVVVLVAFVGYKVLSREAHRYYYFKTVGQPPW